MRGDGSLDSLRREGKCMMKLGFQSGGDIGVVACMDYLLEVADLKVEGAERHPATTGADRRPCLDTPSD